MNPSAPSKKGVENGTVALSRYTIYLGLLETDEKYANPSDVRKGASDS